MTKKTVYGLVGPTASGKTGLSLDLARHLRGEILCMDSMQVYKDMDIGTAKPTAWERAQAPHHLLDLVSPASSFTVAEYAALARPLLDSIPCPVLVGGTGLYLRALSYPMELGKTPGDPAVRDKYQRIADERGNAALHAYLAERDPVSAARLHPNDVRRVVRALEVLELTGKPFSAQVMPDENETPYRFALFAVSWPRDQLYRRIDLRVDQMMRDGLLEEVRTLMDSGVPRQAQSMKGLGYQELYAFLCGEGTLPDAVEMIKRHTRNYAKRQLTWFRADKRIHWLNADEEHPPRLEDILYVLEEKNVASDDP